MMLSGVPMVSLSRGCSEDTTPVSQSAAPVLRRLRSAEEIDAMVAASASKVADIMAGPHCSTDSLVVAESKNDVVVGTVPLQKFSERYIAAMEALDEGGYVAPVEGLAERSVFHETGQGPPSPPSKGLLKRIMKEIKQFEKQLEKSPRAAMFVRFDVNEPQYMQAMLTGVGGANVNEVSSYAHGCFLFDIYIPADYPNVPPKCKHVTPGSTTVNESAWGGTPGGFSPNMHRLGGQVCLSLLGTWDDGPGWDKEQGTVYQVLSSILWCILSIKHPYFNEPGLGYWEGTAPNDAEVEQDFGGDHAVLAYTEEVRRGTLQVALLDAKAKPFPGFEDVIAIHMAAKWTRALATAKLWAETAKYSKAALEACVTAMELELGKLGEERSVAAGNSAKAGAVDCAKVDEKEEAKEDSMAPTMPQTAAEGGSSPVVGVDLSAGEPVPTMSKEEGEDAITA